MSTLTGIVRDPQGDPIGCAVVVLDAVTAVASTDGQWGFTGVAPGSHTLAVAAGGFTPQQTRVDVGPGQESADVTLQPSETGAIAGAVVDPAGAPIVGATVTLDRAVAATTGPRGDFVFPDVAPGGHTLDVTAQGYEPQTYATTTTAGVTTTPTFELAPSAAGAIAAPGISNAVALGAAAAGAIAFVLLVGPKRRHPHEYRS